ncbi:MAG: PQQ-binding-like beta-propeller repeat protein [Thermomicrobiales bacterium]|nr:PQQ-binding-like beta-propeller repeat protein [Thermomicrobiales bacterium]
MNDTQERFTTLDMALDQLENREASRPVPEREIDELLAAAREFGVVAASGGQEPHEDFVRRLEAQLAPSPLARSVLHSQALPEPRQPGVHGGGEHAVQWRHMRVFPLVAALLVIAMLLGAVAAITQMRSPDDFPTMIPAPVFAGSSFLWEIPLTSRSGAPQSVTTVEGRDTIFRFRNDADFLGIEAIDGITGETLWSRSAYGNEESLRTDRYGVYYVGFGETTREGTGSIVVALSPETGEELWRVEIDRYPMESSIRDGRLYIRHSEGFVTAIDTQDGSVLWIAQPLGNTTCGGFSQSQSAHPSVLDDAVVVLDCDGSLVGLDPSSGAEQWRRSGFNAVATLLTPIDNTLIVMTGYRWEGMTGSPGVVADDDLETLHGAMFAVYRVVALNGSDGEVLWERYVAARPQYPVATATTFAIIGAEINAADRDLAALPATPTPDWQGTIVAPGVENHVMGFDLRSGELLWEETLEDDAIYRTLSAWSTETGSGIAATTSNFDIIQVGPWEGGAIVDPGDRFLIVEPPLAGDFGFVAEAIDGRLVGIEVERNP